MNATEWAAWVGALGFAWQVFTWVRSGPRVIVEALANQFRTREEFEAPGVPSSARGAYPPCL